MVSCARPTWRQTGAAVLEDDGGGEELVAPAAQRGELGARLGEVARLVEEPAVADQHLVGAEDQAVRAAGAATRRALSSASASAMSRGGAASASMPALTAASSTAAGTTSNGTRARRSSAARAAEREARISGAGVGSVAASGGHRTALLPRRAGRRKAARHRAAVAEPGRRFLGTESVDNPGRTRPRSRWMIRGRRDPPAIAPASPTGSRAPALTISALRDNSDSTVRIGEGVTALEPCG